MSLMYLPWHESCVSHISKSEITLQLTAYLADSQQYSYLMCTVYSAASTLQQYLGATATAPALHTHRQPYIMYSVC